MLFTSYRMFVVVKHNILALLVYDNVYQGVVGKNVTKNHLHKMSKHVLDIFQ